MNSQPTQITVRLPASLAGRIEEESRNRNLQTLAETVRACLIDHFNHSEIDARLNLINNKLDQISSVLAAVEIAE